MCRMGNGVFLTGDITPKQQFLDTVGNHQIKMDITLDMALSNLNFVTFFVVVIE